MNIQKNGLKTSYDVPGGPVIVLQINWYSFCIKSYLKAIIKKLDRDIGISEELAHVSIVQVNEFKFELK
jgi:hypothetical protein